MYYYAVGGVAHGRLYIIYPIYAYNSPSAPPRAGRSVSCESSPLCSCRRYMYIIAAHHRRRFPQDRIQPSVRPTDIARYTLLHARIIYRVMVFTPAVRENAMPSPYNMFVYIYIYTRAAAARISSYIKPIGRRTVADAGEVHPLRLTPPPDPSLTSAELPRDSSARSRQPALLPRRSHHGRPRSSRSFCIDREYINIYIYMYRQLYVHNTCIYRTGTQIVS